MKESHLLKKSFIQFLIECQALKFGQFTLKSGKSSPFFINLGCISSGRDFEFLGDCLAQTLHEGFPETTSLFGPAYKGIAIATAVSAAYWRKFKINLAVFYDRKEVKSHGEGGNYIGTVPEPDEKVVIVDDVISDGGTKVAAIENLEATFKVKAKGVLVGVDRTLPGTEPGFVVRSVISLKDISEFLKGKNDPNSVLVEKFMEGN